MGFRYGFCIFAIIGYVFVIVDCRETKEKMSTNTVTLYTDLVDIIGRNSSCNRQISNNSIEEDLLFTKQGIVISNYDFLHVDVLKSVINKCDVINIKSHSFGRYNWTCFATENSTSRDRDTNWFFVDCLDKEILTIRCFGVEEVGTVLDNLCTRNDQTENSLCRDFSYGQAGNQAVCSQNFRLRKIALEMPETKASYTSTGDVIAYLCVAFILVTFFIAMLIPAEMCKPTYKYDQELERRIPLEIYAMYGVSYQPAAKKRLIRKSINLEKTPSVAPHLGNVAVVANSPVDWGGIKTKFKFNTQPLLNPVVNGFEGIHNQKDGKSDQLDGRRKMSDNSNGSADLLDYWLFRDPTEVEEHFSSARRESESQSIKRDSLICEEKGQAFDNRRSSFETSVDGGKGTLNKTNGSFAAELLGSSTRVNGNQSPFDGSEIGKTEEQKCHSSAERRFSRINSSCMGSIYNDSESEKDTKSDKHDEDQENSAYAGNDESETGESENDDFSSVDTDHYERKQRKYGNKDKINICTCDCNSGASLTSGTTSGEDDVIVKLNTINEYQSTMLSGEVERTVKTDTCPYCTEGTKRIDAKVATEVTRPRISITVEFPENFGVGNAQPVISHVHESHHRKSKRSLSTELAPISDESAFALKLPRKHSMC